MIILQITQCVEYYVVLTYHSNIGILSYNQAINTTFRLYSTCLAIARAYRLL